MGSLLALEQIIEVYAEYVDDSDPRPRRDDRGHRFQMRVVLVSREQNELANAGQTPMRRVRSLSIL